MPYLILYTKKERWKPGFKTKAGKKNFIDSQLCLTCFPSYFITITIQAYCPIISKTGILFYVRNFKRKYAFSVAW